MDNDEERVILVDSDETRGVLARRLRAQGYKVEEAADAATGADMALRSPPLALIADLWMPSISGVQLCRLLRSEPGTADVAIILRGAADDPKNRFWSERAGANAYVAKGRMGDLVRALAHAVASRPRQDDFFMQLSGGTTDVRDRIARHLDKALFDSVIAAEVRALANAGSWERLFDLLAQFVSQVTRYRWLALATTAPQRLAIHHHPDAAESAEREARQVLQFDGSRPLDRVVDDDASSAEPSGVAIVLPIFFGNAQVGSIALAPVTVEATSDASLVALIARELGGPMRMTTLVEESQRLAATDALTGMMNRRAFGAQMQAELARSLRHGYPLSLALLDVDHFKLVNDRHGHASGDRVLAAVGQYLRNSLRISDLGARWGGEEFVVSFTSTPAEGALEAAERLRKGVEDLHVVDGSGARIAVTASFGVATLQAGEALESLVDRADRAMYASKTGGRNRVSLCAEDRDRASPSLEPNRRVAHENVQSGLTRSDGTAASLD